MKILHPVPPSDFRQQSWANGKGRTTELATGPDHDHWTWRISMAYIDADGAFSVLPGVRRQLAPLDGGLALRFDDGEQVTGQRLQVLAFDGARALDCHLSDGPGRAFNLMLRDDTEGTLMARPLLDSMVLLPIPGRCWFAFVLAGSCQLTAGTERLDLGTGAAAWIQPPPGTRALIGGGGEIALVRFDRLPARV